MQPGSNRSSGIRNRSEEKGCADAAEGPRRGSVARMEASDAEDEIVELANDYLERCRNGARPPLSEYTAKHPELEEQIRDLFPMMLMMEDNAPSGQAETPSEEVQLEQLGDFAIQRVIGRGGMGIVYEAIQESLGRHVALKVCPSTARMSPRNRERFRRESRAAALLHHTNIVSVFAVGEQDGMLYYAMQYIRGASLDDVIRELRILWQSNPASVSRVSSVPSNASRQSYDVPSAASAVAMSLVGEQDGLASMPELRMASKHATGDTADVSLPSASNSGSSRGGQYWESVARIGMQVADALSYAHTQGTLHRDIKPANLMLDHSGTVWVMDFGLAKSLEEDDLTRDGELIGTLRYMSPEQCTGSPDVRSDVYSLGLTLYELLALQPAFGDLHRSKLVRAIAEQEPIPPRKINPQVPKDLETIVLKAIEKDPARRYSSAAELEGDLLRFLEGEPIKARPTSNLERLNKWVRRRPLVASLCSALLFLCVVSFALISWNWRRAEYALGDAKEQARLANDARFVSSRNQQLAESRLEMAEAALYRGAISRAGMLSSRDPQEAQKILESLVPGEGDIDRRGWEWGYLQALVNQQVATIEAGIPGGEWIWDISFSPDDSILAVAAGRPSFVEPKGVSPPGRATLWDMKSFERLCEIPVVNTAYDMAVSHDNRRVVVSEVTADNHFEYYWAGQTKIWDIETQASLVELALPKDEKVCQLGFSRDDQFVYGTTWKAGEIRSGRCAVWDSRSGELLWSIDRAHANGLAKSDRGIMVVERYFSDNPEDERWADRARVTVHDVKTGQHLRTLVETIPASGFYSVDMQAIVESSTRELKLISMPEGVERSFANTDPYHLIGNKTYHHPIVAVDEDRKIVASGGTDGSICIWDVESGVPALTLRGHTNNIQSLEFSHDRKWLASGDWNGQVRLWQPDTRPEYFVCHSPTQSSGSIPSCEAVSFRLDGAGIVVYNQGRIEIFEAESGELLKLHWVEGISQVKDHREACFDGKGEVLALAQADHSVHLIEVETGEVVAKTDPVAGRPLEVEISADGSTLAVNYEEGASPEALAVCEIWRVKSSGVYQLERIPLEGKATALSLSPDGRYLLVATNRPSSAEMSQGSGSGLTLKRFDLNTGEQIRVGLRDFQKYIGNGNGSREDWISAIEFGPANVLQSDTVASTYDIQRFAIVTTEGHGANFRVSARRSRGPTV